MLISKKCGNIYVDRSEESPREEIFIEWHEADKRIIHKTTSLGIEVTLRFLNERPAFRNGDILEAESNRHFILKINPCKCIVISPRNFAEVASCSYEIGNRHLPLFCEGEELITPYDAPLHNILAKTGYKISVNNCIPANAINTTVLPHIQLGDTVSLNKRTENPISFI